VSVVVDGVVAARQAQAFADFADLERVEILRGPQGTLFGKNATAGVINVVTARPSRTFQANGDVTIAEQDEYRARATVSGPLSDTLRVRLTGYYNDVGGYERDAVTGTDYAGTKGYGARGKIEWDATENLNLLASADYRHERTECCRLILVSTTNPALAALYSPVVPSRDNRSIADDVPSYYVTEQETYSLQADWDVGGPTVTSITAYQKFRTDNHVESDGIRTPVPIYTGGSSGAFFAQWNENEGQVDLHNFSQELRIASPGGGDFTYVAGGYYSDFHLDRGFQRRRAYCSGGVFLQPCAPGTITYQSAAHVAQVDTSTLAAFGQAEYRIAGGLKLIGGLRVQREKTSTEGYVLGPEQPGDVLFPGQILGGGKRSVADTAITGKAGVQYEFSRRAQMYGSYTRGYKGRGFDTEGTADFARQDAVKPENVNAYEIGFKGETADRTFSVNTALFLAEYSNLQVQANQSDPTSGLVKYVQTNAGTSKTRGFEVEATIRPSSVFSVAAGVTYAKATVNIDGLNCPLQFQGAAQVYTSNYPINTCYKRSQLNGAGVAVVSGPIQDVRNGALPAAPRWRISFAPELSLPISDNLNAVLRVNGTFQSKQNFAIEQDPLLEQGAFALFDLNLGIRQADGLYGVNFFVKNLFDKQYFSNLGHGQLLATIASPNDLYANFNKDSERYFGVTFSARLR
jgi:iron complex outermembrane receptor protein